MALNGTMDDYLQFVYEGYLGASSCGGTDVARHPGLIRELADLAGIEAPQRMLVVTGSKGKGSVSALAAAALSGAGQRCGLVTSPHLIHLTERIRVDGRAIGDTEFREIVEDLEPLIRRYAATLPSGVYLGPSGLYLLFALRYFQQMGIDTAVVEAGRGGLLDESTRFGHSIAAITTVRLEHPAELGPELEDIARHKAGAIPLRGHAFCAHQEPSALAILRDRAAAVGATLLVEGEGFLGEARPSEVAISTPGAEGTRRMPFRPAGLYQASNAALALAAAEQLLGQAIERPLWAELQLPGRLQQISASPDVIVDGAIVRASAEAAVRFAKARGRSPIVAVIGVPVDKDYRGVISVAGAAAGHIIVTRTATARLSYPEDALAYAASFVSSSSAPTLAEALREAEALAGAAGLVLVLGTQSLVAEALRHYSVDPRHIY